jgi:DNA-binding protein HU-beta
MTKADVITQIVEKTGADKSLVSDTIESFFDVITEAVTKNETVYFRGFGSFAPKKRAAKVARNIQQNTMIQIDEHFIPKFKPSKSFIEKVKTSVK